MTSWRRMTPRLLAGAALGWACSSLPPAQVPNSETAGASAVQEIRVAGSQTMVHLNRRLATEFMVANPGVAVVVEGGGTSLGIEALISGGTDLCAASRPLAGAEVRRLHEARGVLGVQHLVALDAIVVMVHPGVGIDALTSAEAAALFSGRVRRWTDLGGPDLEVVPVRRPASSGTHRLVRDILLGGGPWSDAAVVVSTPAEMVSAVAETPGAIGYGRHGSPEQVQVVRIDGAAADPRSVTSGGYPLGRYLYLYSAAPPEGKVRAFLEWVLGPEGQATVKAAGFIPLWVHQEAPDPA